VATNSRAALPNVADDMRAIAPRTHYRLLAGWWLRCSSRREDGILSCTWTGTAACK